MSRLLYVGTDLGVFVSTNGGQTWGIYSTSPANSTVLDTILPLDPGNQPGCQHFNRVSFGGNLRARYLAHPTRQ